jgi:glycosyltransferase involved in cell wall biosynthesis
MMRAWIERLFEWRMVRWLAAAAFLARGAILLLLGRRYRAISDFCWVVRVSRVAPLQRTARARIDRELEVARRMGRNPLVAAYLASSLSRRCAATFSLAGTGPNDLFRDLIVLKSATPDERGVILLKYARTFEAVVALLDFDRLLTRYTFVLEPCWAGYCDPALLMHFTPGHPVVVQCFTAEDLAFVESVGPPFVPVALGPADWVSADIFRETAPQAKVYDLVMVANWGAHKRHAELFRALSRIDDRKIRVLLVGFPWAGRTASDIRREARGGVGRQIEIEIVEQISQAELARYLSQCKAFVFLSRKEGDNKALVEAMFADVPAIVYDRSIGGAVSRINPATGILSSDEDLADRICFMLDHYRDFRPRTWALEHTGSPIATRVLDDALRRAASEFGTRYTRGIVEKINAPNLAYRKPELRAAFQADYEFITSCLRPRSVT